ncbi:MAG: galactose-1-phosphate uridylyltransferase [Candidatus Paceibacterota bacterium]|jgi:UDPglucose--hexose-1-phosphate uridylyltransferase|nr:galactose-1-phosphate uridylyltransferase [bacterium]
MKNEKDKEETELRKNLLSGDWVIIAPTRSKIPKKNNLGCPFCNLKNQETPILIYNNGKIVSDTKKWTTIVVPNKYPVFVPLMNEYSNKNKNYYRIKSPGSHELIITSDHNKKLYELGVKKIKEILDCYQSRIISLKKNKFVKYVFIFQNCGEKAGASQIHPHSQLITIPFIDKELTQIISNSKNYFKKNNKCLHCEIIEKELHERKRIIAENKSFIAYIPFAPKFVYQVIITPKKHNNLFEDISEEEKLDLAEIFKKILQKYNKKLNSPDYNFYLHNSPADNKNYNFFHWYFSLIPRLTYLAGFEIGANMEIITKYPEDQAQFLRK